jgi:hypothetical protein
LRVSERSARNEEERKRRKRRTVFWKARPTPEPSRIWYPTSLAVEVNWVTV